MPIFNRKSDEFFCPPPNQFEEDEEEIYAINFEETFEDIMNIPFNDLPNTRKYFNDFFHYMCFVLNNIVPDDDFHKPIYSKIFKYLYDFEFEDLEEYNSYKDAVDTITKYFKNSLKMFNVTNGEIVIICKFTNDFTMVKDENGNYNYKF